MTLSDVRNEISSVVRYTVTDAIFDAMYDEIYAELTISVNSGMRRDEVNEGVYAELYDDQITSLFKEGLPTYLVSAIVEAIKPR